ncbi:MAG: histidine kinase [Bacteroidota bacterium]
MRKKGFLILYLFLSLLNLSVCEAQNPHPHFQNFTTDQGLPSPEVYCILQDSKGYMWFGTDNGVSRFDGYTFENYSVTDGLKNSVVFHLQEDLDGKIWMSTMAGNLYYFEKERIYPYRHNRLLQRYNRNNIYAIHDFYFTPEGTLYASIRFMGILRVDPDGQEQLFNGKSPVHDFIFSIPNDRLILVHVRSVHATAEDHQPPQIMELRKEGYTHKFSFPVNTSYDSSKRILELENEEGYLVHGSGYTVYLIDTTLQWMKKSASISLYSYENANGEIFISGLTDNGVKRYKNLDALYRGKYEEYLEGFTISWITQDRQGGYWLASLEKGVFYCPNMDMKIFDQSNGLANNLISTITAKSTEELFVGLRTGEVYQLFPKRNQIEQLPGTTREKRIFDIKYNPVDQRLWNAGILYYYDQNNWRPFNWQTQKYFPPNLQAKELFILPEKYKLWTNSAKGVSAFDIRDNRLLYQSWDDRKGNSNLRTLAVYENEEERVWVGTVGGLFEIKNEELIPVMDPDSIFSIRVEDIDETEDGVLVIGTKGAGVVLWKDQRYQYLDISDGLTSNMVEHVHVDAADQIWVGTLAGLNKIVRNAQGNYQTMPITMAHGLPSNEINALTSVGDQIWAATPRGVVHFSVSDFSRPSPSPIIERITVNNELLTPQALRQLSSRQNNLQFSFLAINYPLVGNIPYRYRLRSNADWILTKARSANFLNLAPGNYRFEVQAQNENGRWSESATLQLIINPPFWRTIWFSILAILAALGLGYGLYRVRVNRIIEQNQLQRKIDQLERSALKAQMNPHFIFNCLNSIQSYILEGNKKEAADYLARFAKLIRAILNFSASGSALLEEEIVALKNYLKLEQMRFKHRFEYCITVAPQIDPLLVRVPTMLVQPFVENAIIHGVASRKSGGMIDISYQVDQNFLEVLIKDNGKGFSAKVEPLQSIHKSVGMSITQRRLELLNQDTERKGVDIQELKDEEGQTVGTAVRLKIKLLPV